VPLSDGDDMVLVRCGPAVSCELWPVGCVLATWDRGRVDFT
jgi:hypothetical protein